jgi:sigma-B regulation protein RsbU (phosphoserine phosphatase)
VDDHHLALVIADVSGKGVPAALFMVISKTLIKNRLMSGDSPAQALMNVNEQLCEGNEAEYFVTVWAAVVDLRTGEVVEANAGHEYPALCQKDGSYELVRTKHSPAVAIMEGMRFRERSFRLNPGDRLFVYTDGVTEATDAQNQLFGEERLVTALNQNPGLTQEKLLASVRESIDTFVGEAPQFDDLTMLGFEFRGEQK